MDKKTRFQVKGFPPVSAGGAPDVFTGFITQVAHTGFRMIPQFSPCGVVCDYCIFFKGERQPTCPGCRAVEGKPFWGSCETYACAEKHGVEHCGLCGDFPCDGYISRYDPSEGPKSAVLRAGLLAYRARHGGEKTIELINKIEEKD
jgi:hypothetical protein